MCATMTSVFVFTDASGMDWSTMYANALAQMLSDKNISGTSSSHNSDVITLPRSTATMTTPQQPQDTELKQSPDSQLKNLLRQPSPSRGQSDLLASSLRSHSPNHSLTISVTAGGTSPKAMSQDLHSSNSSIPSLSLQNHDPQSSNLVGLSTDKAGGVEDNKQRLSPYHAAMMAAEQQLSPNTAALGIANLSGQKSPSRQQKEVKEEPSLAAAVAGTTALPGKEEMTLSEDTKLFLKQLAQQQMPHPPPKSLPGSIIIPGGGSLDQQEELTIHPGGSGELVVMSFYIIT